MPLPSSSHSLCEQDVRDRRASRLVRRGRLAAANVALFRDSELDAFALAQRDSRLCVSPRMFEIWRGVRVPARVAQRFAAIRASLSQVELGAPLVLVPEFHCQDLHVRRARAAHAKAEEARGWVEATAGARRGRLRCVLWRRTRVSDGGVALSPTCRTTKEWKRTSSW